jgi:hypothetical protein
MNESAKYEAQKKKLQGLCDEHHLVYSLEKNSYPITLTLRPTGEVGGQMKMPEMTEDDNSRSPDATLVLSITDGELDIQTSETFTISATLLDKLKSIFKKMHSFWLQFLHREIIEHELLAVTQIPVIEDSFVGYGDEDDDDDEDKPTMKATVDGSGLVTHVEFTGGAVEEPDDDDDEGGDGAYDYDDPEDNDHEEA